MNELLGRVRDLYVAPEATRRSGEVRSLAPAPAAAVLGRAPEAPALAAALALRLARTGGWPTALTAGWRAGNGPSWRLPPRAAARRLAARLQAQGQEASAAGRLVAVPLPDPAGQAAAAAERVTGAVRGPVTLALCGPRAQEVDALLRLQDVIVLATRPDDDPSLAQMAMESLAGLVAPVVVCQSAPGPCARGLAAAGAGAVAELRRAILPVLEAVR